MFEISVWPFPETLIIIFLILLAIKQLKWALRPSLKLPPGPKRLPLIGNLHQLGQLPPHRSFQLLAKKYGPLMFLQLGSVKALVISSPDVAKEVFKGHDVVFANRPTRYAAKRISYGYNDITFSAYGEYWRQIRKIVTLELMSVKKVKSFAGIRDEEVQHLMSLISQNSSNKSAALTVNLSDLTLVMANNVVSRVSFGKKNESVNDDGGEKFHKMFVETQNILGGFNVVDFFPWMSWICKFNGLDQRIENNFIELDQFYDGIISEHRNTGGNKEPENEDLVDVLLRLQKDPRQAITLTDEQIKGVITDMFIAGTDTTSATIVWVMSELVRNPSVMKKVQEEIRELVGDKGQAEETDIPKFDYLKLVVKETLRLRPPVPLMVPHETTDHCIIKGYDIPSKTRVFFHAQMLATDPEWWEDPLEFRPERFMGTSVDFKGQNFHYLPFGSGRRICPAVNFSLPLVELALANLLYRFDWKLPEGMKTEDLNMEESFGLAMHKKVPLSLVATPAIVEPPK